MGKRSSYDAGTFCLVGLATSDPASASDFYASILGWEAEESTAAGAEPVTLLRRDSELVAILYRQMESARAAGAPPHWTSYVSVEDADATVERATQLGATRVGEPFDAMDAGRVAAIRDPVGAIVSLWQPRAMIGATLVNDVGALCWNELATPDLDTTATFYGELFGWGFEPIPTGPGGPEMRSITNAAGWKNGSISKLETELSGEIPNWTPYFGVAACPEAVAQVLNRGGTVVLDTLEIPTGRLALGRDPQGAVFGFVDGEMDP